MSTLKTISIGSTAILTAAMLSATGIAPVAANQQGAVDGGTAAGLCATSYPGVSGPEELSPCQWDMQVVNALSAHEKSTGLGVKVGVIDGGVDFTHPDLAGGINEDLSCSFIFSTTPTADPTEVADGDCSNKAAV